MKRIKPRSDLSPRRRRREPSTGAFQSMRSTSWFNSFPRIPLKLNAVDDGDILGGVEGEIRR